MNVQRFLKSIGAAVPEIYVADLAARMLLVEDVGETLAVPGRVATATQPATSIGAQPTSC